MTNNALPQQPSILVIGAGFGGIATAAELARHGFQRIKILERATAPGGVWHANRYPGARCDNPSALYSLARTPSAWSARFADRAEIHAYAESVLHGITPEPEIEFGKPVTMAVFDDDTERWRVTTADGRVHEADVVVSATGQLSEPLVPDIPGAARFRGSRFHSAHWDCEVRFDGKRVAVIGTGASAAQVVPWLRGQAASVRVYQRSAPWVLPKADIRYSPLRRRLSALRPVRLAERSIVYAMCETLTLAVTRLPVLGRALTAITLARMRSQIPDPVLRRRLTPDYPLGAKRCLFSDTYYAALSSPNVTVDTTAIDHLTESGIVTVDGIEKPCDIIVYCTGFRTADFASTVEVHGRAGAALRERWADGPCAYLGMTVPEFPNFFLVAGPNTNLTFGSVIVMLECQARYIAGLLARSRAAGVRAVEIRAEVYDAYRDWITHGTTATVWTKARNPYRHASGRVTSLWPFTMTRYRLLTRRPRLTDYLPGATTRSRARRSFSSARNTA